MIPEQAGISFNQGIQYGTVLCYNKRQLGKGRKELKMDKYKVLLVDDEEEAIEAIRLKLEWETLGFEVIGSANNGVKALELVERLQPDVVITDIKMPYMDGLELARALNEDYQNIHIIIFTGFDEFEYAKEAIKIGISDYLLKPVTSVSLLDTLKHVADEIREEQEKSLLAIL